MRIFGLFLLTPFVTTQVVPPPVIRYPLVYAPPRPVVAFVPHLRLQPFNGFQPFPNESNDPAPPSAPPSAPQRPQLIIPQQTVPVGNDNTVAVADVTTSLVIMQLPTTTTSTSSTTSTQPARQPVRLTEDDQPLRVSEVLERLPSAQQFIELGIQLSGEDAPVKRSMYLNFYASCLIRQGEPTDQCFESTETAQCINHPTHHQDNSVAAGHHHLAPPGFLWGCFIRHAKCPEFNANIWATDCEGATSRFLQCLTGATPQPDEIELIKTVCSTAR